MSTNVCRDDRVFILFQVSLILSCESLGRKQLKRKYLRCSGQTSVLLLKKYLAMKLHFDMIKFKDFDILCNDELMGKNHSLKFILLTRWRSKVSQIPNNNITFLLSP